MKNKLTKVLLIVSMLVLLIFVACACGGEEVPDVCLHSEQTVLEPVAPTCTTIGLTAGAKCANEECGEVLIAQSEIPATGHTETILNAVSATCTSKGLTEGKKCSVCNAITVAQTEVEALGHTEVVLEAVAPNCTTNGKTEGKKCSTCDTVLVAQETVNALGHTPVVLEAVLPTCTEAGKTEGSYCSVCDATITAQETVKALGHTEVTLDAVAPTCTEAGKTEGKVCSVCDATIKAQETVDATGHDINNYDAQELTCTQDGWEAYEACSNCDYTTKVVVPATGHVYVDHEAQAVTCTVIGWDAYQTCENCDYTSYVEIPATGHTYVDHEAQDPTCTEIGWDAYQTCENCDYTSYVEIPATGHTDEEIPAVPATCDEVGYTAGVKCSVCEDVTTEPTELPKLGHNWVLDESKLTSGEPTCKTEGNYPYYCDRENCDATSINEEGQTPQPIKHANYTQGEYKVAPTCISAAIYNCGDCGDDFTAYEDDTDAQALGHDYQDHGAQAVTCTAVGWDAYQTCSRCDYTTYVEIPALGHDEQPNEAQEVTCLEIGWDAYVTCSRCDYTTYVEIPALGHDEQPNEAQEVTCTEIGWDAYVTCSRCDYTTYVEIPATGHAYTAWKTSQEPTCTADGEEVRNCLNCTLVEKQVIDKLGHDYEEHVAQDPTCTEIGWNAYQTCSRCDYTTYVEIPALGHDEQPNEAQAVTCLEIGWDAYVTCSRCDYTTYVEIPALGHDYEDHLAKAPTCLEIGWDAYQTCSRCDYTTYQDDIAALGHTYERANSGSYTYVVDADATCIADGIKWVVCTECNYNTKDDAEPDADKYSVVIPATGAHIYDDLLEVVDPKCGVAGYTIYGCSVDDNCVATENRDETEALDHDWVLDESKLTNGAPSCLTNGDWAYMCTNGCGEVEYNLEGEENSGAVHGGYTDGEWKVAATCITPATYHCTFCDTDFSASLYPEIQGQATGVHALDVVLEESTASCTAYGYKVIGCSADENCTKTDVVDWADKLDHNFGALDEVTGTLTCQDCGVAFRNVTADVSQEKDRLCADDCEGCAIHDMVVIVTSVKEPDEDTTLPEGTPTAPEATEKTISLIALNGAVDTTYTIVLRDAEGNEITSFEVTVADETNAFDVTTTVTGNAYVDISEVADIVESIEITASADASVAFYNTVAVAE